MGIKKSLNIILLSLFLIGYATNFCFSSDKTQNFFSFRYLEQPQINLKRIKPYKIIVPDNDLNAVRFYELPEPLLGRIDTSKQYSNWLLWKPVDNKAWDYLIRSIDFTVEVTIPSGNYYLDVKPLTIVRNPGTKADGLLVFLYYDPTRTSGLKLYYPPLLQTALDKSMLNEAQLNKLEEHTRNLEPVYKEFQINWTAFAANPGDYQLRNKFFYSLIDLYLATKSLNNIESQPYKFFTEQQRIALRDLGYEIRGTARVDYHHSKIIIANYPIKQLVNKWNEGKFWVGSPVKKIHANKEFENNEVNLESHYTNNALLDQPALLKEIIKQQGISLVSK